MRLRILAVLVVLLAAPSLYADQPSYFSTQAALSGNSTMALDQSGGSAWLNPAGLAGTGLSRIEVSGTAFVLQLRDYSRTVVATLPSGAHHIDAHAVDLASIPAALVFARQLHPRVTGALGFFVTAQDHHDIEGGVTSEEQFPGSPNALSFTGRAQLSLDTQTYRIGPAFGFLVTPRLRLGFGVFVTYATQKDVSNVTLGGVDRDGSTMPSTVYLTSIVQRRNTWIGGQITLGAQWNPVAGLYLGLLVRTPVLGFYSTGRISRSSAAVSSGTAFPGQPFTYLDDAPSTSAQKLMLEPFSTTIGLSYRLPRGLIGAELDLRAPNRVTAFEIDDQFTWNVRVGGQVELPKRILLGLAAFTDRSPRRHGFFVGDSRADYYGLSASLAFDSVYTLITTPETAPRSLIFLTVVSVRYAVGFADLTTLDYAPKAATLPELGMLNQARRSEVFHSVALQISSSVSF